MSGIGSLMCGTMLETSFFWPAQDAAKTSSSLVTLLFLIACDPTRLHVCFACDPIQCV